MASRVPHTVEYLNQFRAVLAPAVKRVVLSVNTRGAGNTGLRLLNRGRVPQLRYHNPHVTFERRLDAGGLPSVAVEFADGQTKVLDANNKKVDVILQELLAVTKPGNISFFYKSSLFLPSKRSLHDLHKKFSYGGSRYNNSR